jgi:malate dehydrogenase (quinone)
VTQSGARRFDALRTYYPDAEEKDWYCAYAGKRVQIIKKDKKK